MICSHIFKYTEYSLNIDSTGEKIERGSGQPRNSLHLLTISTTRLYIRSRISTIAWANNLEEVVYIL